MIRKTMILFITAALAFSASAVAGEIYKWTDEDGNVHYEDRPDGKEVERVAINSSSTNNSAVSASNDARRAREDARSDARSQRDLDQQRAAEEELLAADRAKKCQESRSRMETYLQARRLYKEGDDGERVYLDDSQIMEARDEAQEDIQAFCS